MARSLFDVFARRVAPQESEPIQRTPEVSLLDQRWTQLLDDTRDVTVSQDEIKRTPSPVATAPKLRPVAIPMIVGLVAGILTALLAPGIGLTVFALSGIVGFAALFLRHNAAVSSWQRATEAVERFPLGRLCHESQQVVTHLSSTIRRAVTIGSSTDEVLQDLLAPLSGELGHRVVWETACDLEAIEHLLAVRSDDEVVDVLRERILLVESLLQEIATEVVVSSAERRGSSDRLAFLLEGLSVYRDPSATSRQRTLKE